MVEWLIVFVCFRKKLMCLCVLIGNYCMLLYGLVFVCVAWRVQCVCVFCL